MFEDGLGFEEERWERLWFGEEDILAMFAWTRFRLFT